MLDGCVGWGFLCIKGVQHIPLLLCWKDCDRKQGLTCRALFSPGIYSPANRGPEKSRLGSHSCKHCLSKMVLAGLVRGQETHELLLEGTAMPEQPPAFTPPQGPNCLQTQLHPQNKGPGALPPLPCAPP